MKITFLIENFTLGSPGQQLLDRFLFDGRHEIHAWGGQGRDLLTQRVQDHRLRLADTLEEAAAAAPPAVIVGGHALQERAMPLLAGAKTFVYGPLSPAAHTLARQRGIRACSGTVGATLLQLPAMNIPSGVRLSKTLVVTHGSSPEAEAIGLDALLALNGETKAERISHRTGPEIWDAVDRTLLDAALSRSDKVQGNTELDGRTEDLSTPDLVEAMAVNPRGWFLEHRGGATSALLFLDGVIADIVAAVETKDGLLVRKSVRSTQLFQAPAPQQEHFSRLTPKILEFLTTGKMPWSGERSVLLSKILESRS